VSRKTKSRRIAARHKRETRRPIGSPVIIGGGLALIGLAAVLIFGGGAFSGPPPTPEVIGAPALKANQEMIDLGDVRLGMTVNASFQLTNVVDQPLFFTESPYVEVVEGC